MARFSLNNFHLKYLAKYGPNPDPDLDSEPEPDPDLLKIFAKISPINKEILKGAVAKTYIYDEGFPNM